jgi:hypothetical protein
MSVMHGPSLEVLLIFDKERGLADAPPLYACRIKLCNAT